MKGAMHGLKDNNSKTKWSLASYCFEPNDLRTILNNINI